MDVIAHPFVTQMNGVRWNFMPESETQRGILWNGLPFEGQTIEVRVAGLNASMRAIELELPQDPKGSAQSVFVSGRVLDTVPDTFLDALRISWRAHKMRIAFNGDTPLRQR